MQLTLKKVREIVERKLKDGKTYSRYINVDFYSKKVGWNIKTDKNRITVITSKLYDKAPYEKDRKQKTISVNTIGNVKKLKEWLDTIY